MKERQKRPQKLCVSEDEMTLIKVKTELQIKEMSRTEIREYWQKLTEGSICLERRMREDEIIAVKVGERFQHELNLTEKILNNITKIAEFFTKKGYSLLDVLIRCCTECTMISTTGYNYDLNLHLIRYSSLWKIMEKAGLLRNLIK